MSTTSCKRRSEQRCFEGVQGFYEHPSEVCGGPMRFAVYLPPAARERLVPVVYYLAGLTCTEETFVIKAGAQRVAAELGVALVTCDTSPRAARYPGDDSDWDFGQGAGFYLNATVAPWAATYRMFDYVTDELPTVVETNFPVVPGCRSIMGHSMGGHGALMIALRCPDLYRSVSAFAPVVAPGAVPWGKKAFENYLGADTSAWQAYDTVELLKNAHRFPGTPLVDQGGEDKFLDAQLKPELLAAACDMAGQPLQLRMQTGYDHSYYFIATFIRDHLRWHAEALHAS